MLMYPNCICCSSGLKFSKKNSFLFGIYLIYCGRNRGFLKFDDNFKKILLFFVICLNMALIK